MAEKQSAPLLEIQSPDEIPVFKNEDEEAEFWSTHSLGDGFLPYMSRSRPEGLPTQRARRPSTGVSSAVLTLDLVNSFDQEYWARFILVAHPVTEGFRVTSDFQWETVFLGKTSGEALQMAAERVMAFVKEAAESGKLESALAARGVTVHKGPRPKRQQAPPPRPQEGWAIRAVTALA